jgi:hypothetical protein
VIYSSPNDPAETKENTTNLHHVVFFNIKLRELHPFAYSEGHGTTLSEGYQCWPKTGPLGAAMRLTALRQSPKEVTRHPKNSKHPKKPRHPKNRLEPPDYSCLRNCGLVLSPTGKNVRVEQHGARYDNTATFDLSTVDATQPKHLLTSHRECPSLELLTRPDTRTCLYTHFFPKKKCPPSPTTNRPSPIDNDSYM